MQSKIKLPKMTKKINPPAETIQEVSNENSEIEIEKKNYVKKLELQRLVLNKLIDSKLKQTITNKNIDQQCFDAYNLELE